MKDSRELKLMANAIRALTLDAVAKANSGHPGMPLGFADVATVLFSEFLKFDATKPTWPDRDRFVLSAGHGSMLLYSLLYLTGYEDCTLDEIKNFRQLHSKTAGHPEYGNLQAIETTTGPLGQGVANAVGMAIAERHLNAQYGDLVNHKTYCVVGDGCLMEGISYEALSIAGHLQLKNLVVLWDNNEITIDGNTSITRRENMKMRMESIGFEYLEADGHDYDSIRKALTKAQGATAPVFISFKTKIGYGSPKESTSKCHGSPIKGDELLETKEKLGCNWGEFTVPEEVIKLWRDAGIRNHDVFLEWKNNLEKSPKMEEFSRIVKGELPDNWQEAVQKFRESIAAEAPKEATRKSSERVLTVLTENIAEMVGGSADLTGSVLTKTPSTPDLNKDSYGGRYINYGIREHAMAAIMNGLALHKGIIPYAGTFFCFADYEKPAIRLSALMEQRVIYVLTHDSIGLGEDGPTHQPVEHLASLRAIPNLNVFRPADLQETLDCYEIALEEKHTPSAMVLSRQGVPFLSGKNTSENNCRRGAYVYLEDKDAKVTLMATGTEVALAVSLQKKLLEKGVKARVVSAPCLDIFDHQSEDYRKSVLRPDTLRVAIEAGSSMGWHKYIGENGLFFGIKDNSFGLSAPAEKLYEYFGLTDESMADKILSHLA